MSLCFFVLCNKVFFRCVMATESPQVLNYSRRVIPATSLTFPLLRRNRTVKILSAKLKIAKAFAKEATRACPDCRTRSARASTSSSTPKPHEFLDITAMSEEERSAGETNGDEVASEGFAVEKSSNTSSKSDIGS
ncbi:uncharacterized protein LOC126628038 [Malus sylvestris]|uniref:uncharacterized protein LOC126628038 n=1 Tax=Malus sylvestris TaxID=3752 RepID=UPI0021ACB8FB|nr:uncharacterized protein LOC126628038 [Malus sylvestris]